MYMYMYITVCIYMYIYIYIERERCITVYVQNGLAAACVMSSDSVHQARSARLADWLRPNERATLRSSHD